MASHNPFLTFVVFTFMVFLVRTPSSGESVTVSLYYETLCPYCANFIVNHLVKLFDTGLISIVNLRLIPWGNAYIQSDGSFVCQHGPDECSMNAIEACTITIYPDVNRHFRFIRCVESLMLENKFNEWVNCFEMSGLGKVPIDCYTGGYGKVLEQKYAAETAQLNPPHRFVPWVLVNNQPLQEDYINFISYICMAYKGSSLPEACKSHHLGYNSMKEDNGTNQVCYVDEKRNFTLAGNPNIKP